MTLTILQIIIAAIGITGSIVGAFIGYWLGFRQFRSERLWERKVEIYAITFDALNDLAEQIDQYWEEMQRDTPLTDPQKTTLSELASAAHKLIQKQARIGSFVLSEQSENNLSVLLRELRNASDATDWVEFVGNRSQAIYKAIDVLKKSARADLRT